MWTLPPLPGPLLWMILAQTVPVLPDTPAGWAGWTGFLASGGVLVWLLFWHLPAKDRQLEAFLRIGTEQLAAKDKSYNEMLIAKDKQTDMLLDHKWAAIAQLSKDHSEVVKALALEFRQNLTAMSEQCDKENTRWAGLLERERMRIKPQPGES